MEDIIVLGADNRHLWNNGKKVIKTGGRPDHAHEELKRIASGEAERDEQRREEDAAAYLAGLYDGNGGS